MKIIATLFIAIDPSLRKLLTGRGATLDAALTDLAKSLNALLGENAMWDGYAFPNVESLAIAALSDFVDAPWSVTAVN